MLSRLNSFSKRCRRSKLSSLVSSLQKFNSVLWVMAQALSFLARMQYGMSFWIGLSPMNALDGTKGSARSSFEGERKPSDIVKLSLIELVTEVRLHGNYLLAQYVRVSLQSSEM